MKTATKNVLVAAAVVFGAASFSSLPALASEPTAPTTVPGQNMLIPSSEHITHARYFARIRPGSVSLNAIAAKASAAVEQDLHKGMTSAKLITPVDHKGHAHYFSELGLRVS